MKIHTFSKINLPALLLLVACAPVERQYSENELLERPPEMVIDRQAVGQETAVASDTVANSETVKTSKGLGSDVSINSDSPLQLKLNRSFDVAWHDLELALKQVEIEITDRDREKGLYYVNYDADDYRPEDSGFLDKSTAFFKNDYSQLVYVLTVEELAGETRVTAAIANEAEQVNHNLLNDKDSTANLTLASDRLLLTLYKNLRDKLVED